MNSKSIKEFAQKIANQDISWFKAMTPEQQMVSLRIQSMQVRLNTLSKIFTDPSQRARCIEIVYAVKSLCDHLKNGITKLSK